MTAAGLAEDRLAGTTEPAASEPAAVGDEPGRRQEHRRIERTVADDWRTPETEALVEAILRLDSRAGAERFLRDLCTLGELHDLAQRWAVVRLLDAGMHYAEISRRTGASTATITRIASWLNHGEGGYREMLDRLRASGGSTYPEGREA